MHHQAQHHERVAVDDDLVERLRCVVDALGGAGLPLRAVIRALLAEATAQLEARRDLEARTRMTNAPP